MNPRREPPGGPPIFYVCGDTACNPGRSGIQTVVRSLAAAGGARREPWRLVVWRSKSRDLRPLPPDWSLGLGAEPLRDPPGRPAGLWRRPRHWPRWWLAGGKNERVPLHRHPVHAHAPAGTWVLMPELLYRHDRMRQLIDYVHRQGWRIAVVLHDIIPVQHPEYVPPELPGIHAEYLRALSHADLILPNSEATAEGWREFIAREKLPDPPARTCLLACDLPGVPRVRVSPPAAGRAGVRTLCVSTLEPRKNHLALFAAYERAVEQRPELGLELDLVGASYVDAQHIADAARALVAKYPGRVRWHERSEQAALRRLFDGCDFTVYPSVLEGFGLPVIESLWLGKPCVCADFGVMAENASGGGCLTTNVRDAEALAGAIVKLAGSAELRERLAREATGRPLKTWGDYAEEVLGVLAETAATGHL